MTNNENPDRMLARRTWSESLSRFIPDGRKEKINSLWLKIILGLSFSALMAGQVFNKTPNFESKPEEGVGIPTGVYSGQSQVIYQPKTYDDLAEIEKERTARQKAYSTRALPKPEPLSVINLTKLTEIPTGSEVKAILISGGTNGTVTAKLTEPLIIDGDNLLPTRTILFGKGSSSDERLYVKFSKAILPDKKEFKIVAEAFDQKDRMLGLKGKKVSDYAFKIAASSGLIFLGGMADGMQEEGGSPFAPKRKSARDAALNGVATASLEQGKRIMDSMDNQSRIEVQATSPIVVIFSDSSNTE